MEQAKDKPKKKRSRRRKLLYWLLIDLIVAGTVIGLLLHKPRRYHPVNPPADANGQAVHPYLHRDLASQFYNNAQNQRPFTMIVLDKLLNEAIAVAQWPHETEGVTFSKPEVLFVPGRMVLMGTADVQGADLVITIELAPRFDEEGLFNIDVEKVVIGAMNITPLAKMVGRKMYLQRLEELPSGPEDLRMKIAGSLLNQKPFDPVFEVEDKWVRLKEVEITEGQLSGRFVPARKPSSSE
ncbi:MAG: hypothetical protein JW993_14955 [Sedimentisphaerales bacterium]|nr:hypothetical protein [Sedimentisphaerales bacterium]